MSAPIGYDPAKVGCTAEGCGSQQTETLTGHFGRRCAAHAPWLELAKAGRVTDAFALLSAYLGRRSV